ncbi:MAG: 4'-phosphopantetheinyl transferase superfamily protein [Sediminibacterium sp.]|jgi:phosphopantetheine--protein transferase-like protein|nr:4'-phosphopantetheinyl transferase superfamily protein [Sediminibacterium sp.]
MPLFYQQNINATTKMAIWAIEEPLAFFDSKLLGRVEASKAIMHPVKRIQHLAARLLLQELLPEADLNNIQYAANGKPFFVNESVHFSISHCNGYAACVISEVGPVGIDIELIQERIKKVASKFLHHSELEKINTLNERAQLKEMCFIWAAKEAMYKMNEKLGIDFSADLRVEDLVNNTNGIMAGSILTEATALDVQLHYELRENFVWAVSLI